MTSCSSASSAYSQQLSIQQLLQKATSPTPQQGQKSVQTNLQHNGTANETNAPETQGNRGKLVNVTA